MPSLRILTAMLLALSATAADPAPRVETWDYVPTAKTISAAFTGDMGKVVPMGDSITYANPASSWARRGVGRTPAELALATWMRAGRNDRSNGWWLAADDQPERRSWTAASGITAGEYLKGGFNGLPSLVDILTDHKPQVALILLGTNDVKQGIPPAAYLVNMEAIYKACMTAGAIPVVTTIMPNTAAKAGSIQAYNDGLFELAGKLKLPFLDMHGEFLKLRPGDTWQMTLISKDGIHPSHAGSEGPASPENLAKCGYLAKCFLQCRKVGELKSKMGW